MTIETLTPEISSRRRPGAKRGYRRIVTWSSILLTLIVATGALLFQVGLWRARLAIEYRQQNSAETWLNLAEWSWPKNAEWHYLSAIVSRRALNFEQVESHLRHANELGWDVTDLEYQQTLAQAQTGQFDMVENRWATLFETAGSDGPEICRSYVNFLLARFRLEEVSTILNGWRKDFPDDPGPDVIEGTITAQLLQWKKAEELYLKALQIDPTLDEARVKLAEALMKQLRFDEAEEQLRLVSAETAKTPDVIASNAHCVAQQGRLDEALQILETASKNNPSNIRLLAEMGRLQLMRADNKGAIMSLARVLEKEPENTEIRYAYAQALRNDGHEKEAQGHFRLVDQGTKALRELSRLTQEVVAHPEDVETRFQVGQITWKWKSRRDGLAWLRSVLEFAPDHKPTHALLAEHYEQEGDHQKAEFHRRKSEGN